jgi:cytochrome c oxidase assembly factor CtaG
MSPVSDAFVRSWPFAPWLSIGLLVTAGVYLRGWLIVRSRDRQRWRGGHLAAFLCGLAAIYLALASPLEPFAALLLQVHMVQHLLLAMVAPPLLWLGAPLFPLLRGLPRPVRVYWARPVLSAPPLRRLLGSLTHPLTALPLFIATTWLWHIPPLYDLALRSGTWHWLQHICFVGAALLFWYPVVRPYPSRPRWSVWLLLPHLILADLSNTVLSAVLTFSNRVLYSHYAQVPRLGGLAAVDDQAAAGMIMWVPGSIAFVVPLFTIGIRLLSGEAKGQRQATRPVARRVSLSLLNAPFIPAPRRSSAGFDLLRAPLVGRLLKWRHARLSLQLPLLLAAVLIIYDGLAGPQVAAMNLAGIVPWIHWRALLVIGLLAAGNTFCMGCPFLLPRTLARRLLPAGRSWPRRLRSKWLAVALIVAFLWAYEALGLWDRPRWTACLALAYFVGAFVIDGFFRGASFCKYLCPIGQFNFVQSLVSPLEIKAREPAVCASCRTKDCIRGRDGIPGCELDLYLPRKAGNMDCTACLDCVHACPHDNVGLILGTPGATLWDDRPRSGIGRFRHRPDIAALILVVVFGAFANAAGMAGPVVATKEQLAARAGVGSPMLATSLFFFFTLVVLPLLATGGAAVLSHRWGQWQAGPWEVATRCVYTLVPLGFGMWLAHYSFHFLTSYEVIVPAAQRFAADLGMTSQSEHAWGQACCRPVAAWLLPLEIVFLDLGLLLSLYSVYRVAPTLKALAPWALLMVLLFATGLWILFQPMQMRGTFP